MISYLMVGSNDLDQSVKFYDELMQAMGATKVYSTETNVGWGWGVGTPMFIVAKPHNEEEATFGNGSMVAFDAESTEQVDAWHDKVLTLGGSTEGDPGLRGKQMYVGYCRDLDGNKLNFIHYLPSGD